MSETYRVKIEKERLVFSAAHFITFNGDICERLHGHNYHVRAEVGGPLDENHYVIDFIALRDSLQEIVDRLDHHMLLPTDHPTIRVDSEGNEVVVTHGERRWVFPSNDCILLPVVNTTAELLAKWIGGELQLSLAKCLNSSISDLVVEVDECDGQWGAWRYQV